MSTNLNMYWARVHKTDTCWLWTGTILPSGYGRYCQQQAHRVAYALTWGPIPDGLELDHLCRVRHCVRPDHLEAVTHAENVRRGNGGRRPATECPRGHRYEGDNVYVRLDGKGRGCRACNVERSRERRRESRYG